MTLLETRPTASELLPSDLPYRFTVAQFIDMLESEILPQEGRFELLEGVIYPLSPIFDGHYAGVTRLNNELALKLSSAVMVSPQNPIAIGERLSFPQPDLTVIRRERYTGKIPTPEEVSLVIEVSDATLLKDRSLKTPLYARHGIPEYWILDVKKNQLAESTCSRLEVYRDPHGEEYRSKKILLEGEFAALLEFPDVQIQWW